MERRDVLRSVALGAATAAAVPSVLATTGQAAAASEPDFGDLGAGLYSDMSTAFHPSPFNLNPVLTTCAVGSTGAIPGVIGSFAMEMFSVGPLSYVVNRSSRTITAQGRMRSITMLLTGLILEDIEHDFAAIGIDHRGVIADRFEMHYTTPLWNGGLLTAISTASTFRSDWKMFGGSVLSGTLGLLGPRVYLGGINVNP
jgi:hypothetical protein